MNATAKFKTNMLVCSIDSLQTARILLKKNCGHITIFNREALEVGAYDCHPARQVANLCTITDSKSNLTM